MSILFMETSTKLLTSHQTEEMYELAKRATKILLLKTAFHGQGGLDAVFKGMEETYKEVTFVGTVQK